MKLAEEGPSLTTESLKSLEKWGYLNPVVLMAGRCTDIAPQGMTDEEKDEYMTKVYEEDKVEERFRMI